MEFGQDAITQGSISVGLMTGLSQGDFDGPEGSESCRSHTHHAGPIPIMQFPPAGKRCKRKASREHCSACMSYWLAILSIFLRVGGWGSRTMDLVMAHEAMVYDHLQGGSSPY